MNSSDPDFNFTCRCCIRCELGNRKISFNLHSLYDKPESAIGVMSIAEIYTATIPQVVIDPSDGLPQVICESCLNKLLDVQKFQIMCLASEQNLRVILEKLNKKQTADTVPTLENEIIVKEELVIDEDIKWPVMVTSPTVNSSVMNANLKIVSKKVVNNLQSVERPHVCEICSAAFKQKYSLNRHRKIHNKTVEKSINTNIQAEDVNLDGTQLDYVDDSQNSELENSNSFEMCLDLDESTSEDMKPVVAYEKEHTEEDDERANQMKNCNEMLDKEPSTLESLLLQRKRDAAAARVRKYRARKRANVSAMHLTLQRRTRIEVKPFRCNRKTILSTKIGKILDAIKEVMVGRKAIHPVARAHELNCKTLTRYISKLKDANIDPLTATSEELSNFVSSLIEKIGGPTIFNEQQENELMEYIVDAKRMYKEFSWRECIQLAYEYARTIGIKYPALWDVKREASKHWYYLYMKRHKILPIKADKHSVNRKLFCPAKFLASKLGEESQYEETICSENDNNDSANCHLVIGSNDISKNDTASYVDINTFEPSTDPSAPCNSIESFPSTILATSENEEVSHVEVDDELLVKEAGNEMNLLKKGKADTSPQSKKQNHSTPSSPVAKILNFEFISIENKDKI